MWFEAVDWSGDGLDYSRVCGAVDRFVMVILRREFWFGGVGVWSVIFVV